MFIFSQIIHKKSKRYMQLFQHILGKRAYKYKIKGDFYGE
ncbi:hypothetical protein HMPREF3201_01070 [Megasphaera sp. MJR8396C]|nr:hypothetical protein HMPREF3201_01070 [Megasphaera sp. MJR8396C]